MSPLSAGQEAIWFAVQLDPTTTGYNDCVGHLVRGPLDVRALAAAVATVTQRHDILRSVFPVVDGVPARRVLDRWQGAVAVRRHQGGGALDEAAAREFAAGVAYAPYDLQVGPLFRVEVLRASATEHVVVLAQHHLLDDGWSLGLLHAELSSAYAAARRGEQKSVDPPLRTYEDFVRWQREERAGAGTVHLRWWLDQLSGAELALGQRIVREPTTARTGTRIVEQTLPQADVALLTSAAAAERVNLSGLLLATFELLIGGAADCHDFVVAFPVPGRPTDEFFDVLGFFANVLPLRARVDPVDRVREHWARTSRTVRAALAHADMPFSDVARAAAVGRAAEDRPLAQVSFQYLQSGVVEELVLEDADVVSFELENPSAAPYLLSLDVVEERGVTVCRLSYLESVCSRSEAEAVLTAYLRLLRASASDPGQACADLLGMVPVLTQRAGVLPQPERPAPVDDQDQTLQDGVEQLVGQLMGEVLGRAPLRAQDDFFALGGSSLPAVRVVARVRERFGIALSVRSLLENPTLRAFARIVSAAPEDRTGGPIPVLAPGEMTPASAAQARMWFLHQLDSDSSAYNMGQAFRFDDRLDVTALSVAAERVAQRQAVLRTRFAFADDELLQVVDDHWSGDVGEHVVHGAEDAVRTFVEHLLERPYDLQGGAVFRVDVVHGDGGDVLVIGVHHVACDGLALRVLLRELAWSYDAVVTNSGAVPELPTLPVQYTDYAAWQQQRARNGELAGQLRYWTEHLRGAPTASRLLSAGSGDTTSRESEHFLVLGDDDTARLRHAAAEQGVTVFTYLLTVFAQTLSRITSERDVLIGVLVAGRERPELEEVVGFYVNLLAVRLDTTSLAGGGRATFLQLLDRARRVVTDALANAEVPFEHVVAEVNPDRVSGVNPLVQVAFQAFEESPEAPLRLGGQVPKPILGEAASSTSGVTRGADLPLAVDVTVGDGTTRIVLTADVALVDPGLAPVLLELYGSAIRSLTRDPHQRLSDSCFVDQDGVPLDSLSLAPADAPATTAPMSLLTTLDQTVKVSPRGVAVRDDRGTWTFEELRAAVLQVRALIGGPGQRVAVHLPRDRGLVAAVLGVLASGGVVVPLDAVEPEGRARQILTSAGVDLLLTDGSGPDLTGVTRLHLPKDLGVGGGGDVRLSQEVPARAAAAVLHTSGTTGRPRGVVLEHRSLETLLAAHQRTRFAGPARRVALSASIAFDAAWDQLLWLVAGHQLVVVPEEVRRDTIQLLQFVREHRIDVLDAPQSQVSLLLELGAFDSDPFPRTIVMGGEAVSPRLWSMLAARDDIESWNFYGPTECTIDALISPLRASTSPVVGRPVDGARVYVLDPGGRSVPPGVAGELHLAGPLLARGYLNDPHATAAAFVPDPYSPIPGARMYRTGDLGRFRQDGSVELLGRLDEQRKIRGNRVEPAEVTATLLSLASVSDAATAYVSDSTGELQLSAYVVTDEPADRVRQLLLPLLPSYLVPSRISVVESIPRSITGKVDHKALQTAPPVADASYEPPRPGVETVVASAMSEVLGVPALGRDDDFFSLGGHSLRAARVVARVRERFGVALSVRSLLDNPSVRTFAVAVAAAPVSSYAGPIPVLPAGCPTPASAAQARMWFLHQLDPSSSAYNMGEAFGFDQRLNLLALSGAIEQLTRRQAVLRTRFEVVESDLRQVVDDRWSGTVVEHVVHGSEDEVREKVEQLLAAPYDLDAGPVFRVDVVHASSQDVLVVGVHHVACDGVSIDVLFRELSTAYDARLAGVGDVLPPLPVQYTDFAAWQRRRTQAGDLDTAVAFWQEHLRGAPTVVQWPGRRGERRDEVASRGVEFEIDGTTTERLRRLAAAEGVTLFTIVFTAFAQTMSRFTGSRDFVLGLPDAGRGHAVLEDLVGFFVNLLPVRVRTPVEMAAGQPEPAFADLLVQARRLLADAFEHAEAPFEQVVGATGPERLPGVNPLVQVSVQVFEEQVDAAFELGGQRARSVRADLRGTRLDLTLDVYLRGAGLCGWIYHDPSVVDVDGAEQVIQLFLAALSDAVAHDVQVEPVGQEESNSMGQEWQRVEIGEKAVELRVSDGQDGPEARRLFPSVGEYPVYDDFLYYVMLQDQPRNVLFESAITGLVQGRVVLELGTGPDLLWSGLAARSGARRVMAVEEIPASAQAALAKAATLPGVPVEVFEGSANDVSLPARADVLIVELVGAIGGAEGIADVVSDAWRRHLAPGARVVPRRVATQVSALGARALLDGPPALHRDIAPYAADVWRSVNSVFDLRMCMTGLTPADLLASSELLEDLHLEADEQQHSDVLSLLVTRAGEVDSLVLWLQLDCGAGEVLDALQVTTNWMPTLVPFDLEEPVPVQPGDRLEVSVVRRLADDVHPEWTFSGEVHRQSEEPVAFRSDSAYRGGPLRQTWLHRALLRHPVRTAGES